MSSGKHAPTSSRSFLISLGTAVAGALAALGIVLGITLVALNAGKDKQATPPTTPIGTATAPTPSLTATASPSSSILPVSQTTLAVLNGTKREGLARGFSERAAKAGYPITRVDQGPATSKSTIYYRAGARAEALRFQNRFSEFTVVAEAPPSFKADVVLTIVVGDDYKPPPSPTPSHSASPSPSKSQTSSPSPSPSLTLPH